MFKSYVRKKLLNHAMAVVDEKVISLTEGLEVSPYLHATIREILTQCVTAAVDDVQVGLFNYMICRSSIPSALRDVFRTFKLSDFMRLFSGRVIPVKYRETFLNLPVIDQCFIVDELVSGVEIHEAVSRMAHRYQTLPLVVEKMTRIGG